jgi:hypothetical protein
MNSMCHRSAPVVSTQGTAAIRATELSQPETRLCSMAAIVIASLS